MLPRNFSHYVRYAAALVPACLLVLGTHFFSYRQPSAPPQHQTGVPPAVDDVENAAPIARTTQREKRMNYRLRRKMARRKKNMPSPAHPALIEHCASAPSSGNSNDYALGFTSLSIRSSSISAPIEGTIPEWLNGSFMAIGPGVFESEKAVAELWLDGQAMVHNFSIDNGMVCYTNRLLDTKYTHDGIFISPIKENHSSVFSKIASVFSDTVEEQYDNNNVNIVPLEGSCCLALNESTYFTAYDRTTLETTSCQRTYCDTLKTHVQCPHPIYDRENKYWLGLATTFGYSSYYTLYRMDPKTLTRLPLAQISASYPACIHSFSVTPNYVIIIEPPFIVNPLDFFTTHKRFLLDYFRWAPERGTKIHVLDRRNGYSSCVLRTEPFFFFHNINAFEQDQSIVIDLCAYPDASITDKFFLEHLRHDKAHAFPRVTPTRITIDLDKQQVAKIPLTEQSGEFPRINEQMAGTEYRYSYLLSTSTSHEFFDRIIKLDATGTTCKNWSIPGYYFTDPYFIQRPGSITEDDGVLLTIALDTKQQRSALCIIDANSMTLLAQAHVPHHIPFTMHSLYLAKREPSGTD